MDKAGTTAFLELRSLSKGFDTTGERLTILEDVNFTLLRGESIAVVGASGIGKSTLLHILGTLDRPDSGCLLFDGLDVFGLGDASLARFRNQRIGFVFQFHNLLAGFSAVENVMMPGLIQGMSKPRIREKAVAILERVGLAKRAGFRVEDLSGGEQQRVALARALVLGPDLLLADEPTGNLDKENSAGIHRLLMELNQELAMTLVVVTHNESLAGLMQRKVTIERARIIPSDESAVNPKFGESVAALKE